MKAIQLFIVSVIALVSSSCIVPIYRNKQSEQQPYQTPQFQEIGQGSVRQSGTAQAQPQRRLSSVNVTQIRTGHMEAQVKGVDLSNRDKVAKYAAGIYEKTGRTPTEAELTRKFGFPCRARWIDEPDQKVKTITVRPDQVPANIRARFQ
jgi:hypothetical protein